VIAHETGVVNTIDPLGGSYYLEELTNRLEAQAYEIFAEIDRLGGMVAAIEQNYPQREIAEAAYRYQQEVEAGQRIVVGVNGYQVDDEEPIPILKIDLEAERTQVARLEAFKASRDAAAVEQRLAELRRAAAGDTSLMPPIIEAARAGVTMGEMCDAWRQVWGTWRETPVF
jgi:methylmalonyl-CoA mutase N-terminal domain/subunit